jgi:hypothetical protein
MIVVRRYTAANRITFDKSQIVFEHMWIRINSDSTWRWTTGRLVYHKNFLLVDDLPSVPGRLRIFDIEK